MEVISYALFTAQKQFYHSVYCRVLIYAAVLFYMVVTTRLFCTGQVKEVMQRVFHQVRRTYDSTVRTCALNMLLTYSLTRDDLSRILFEATDPLSSEFNMFVQACLFSKAKSDARLRWENGADKWHQTVELCTTDSKCPQENHTYLWEWRWNFELLSQLPTWSFLSVSFVLFIVYYVFLMVCMNIYMCACVFIHVE